MNKNRGVTVTQTDVFIIPMRACFGQRDHHQVILEEYTNYDGIHIKSYAIIVVIISIPSSFAFFSRIT
jgi:hypothetical protein